MVDLSRQSDAHCTSEKFYEKVEGCSWNVGISRCSSNHQVLILWDRDDFWERVMGRKAGNWISEIESGLKSSFWVWPSESWMSEFGIECESVLRDWRERVGRSINGAVFWLADSDCIQIGTKCVTVGWKDGPGTWISDVTWELQLGDSPTFERSRIIYQVILLPSSSKCYWTCSKCDQEECALWTFGARSKAAGKCVAVLPVFPGIFLIWHLAESATKTFLKAAKSCRAVSLDYSLKAFCLVAKVLSFSSHGL